MADSPDLQSIRKHVMIAFALTVIGAAAGEWIKAMLFPELQTVTSHLITLVIASIVAVVAARWIIRGQTELYERVTEETSARARLEELQGQLIERTVELED